jgi:hypothetical protein
VSFPLEAILKCNGWDERMDGFGGLEDCEFGLRVGRVTKTWFFPDAIATQIPEDHDPISGNLGGAAAAAQGLSVVNRCKGFNYRDAQGLTHWMTWNHVPIWNLTAHKAVAGDDGFVQPVYDQALDVERTRYWTPDAFPWNRSLDLLRRDVRKIDPHDGIWFDSTALDQLRNIWRSVVDWRDGQPLEDM